VIDDVRTGQGMGERGRIEQIAPDDLDGELTQEAGALGRSNDSPDALAAGHERFGDMAPKQAGGARDDVQLRRHALQSRIIHHRDTEGTEKDWNGARRNMIVIS
jgi:hypothetical protein